LQIAVCRAVADEKRWQIFDVYADKGASGMRDDRPELNRLRTAAREGHFEYVIIESETRLAQSPNILLKIREELLMAGVTLHVLRPLTAVSRVAKDGEAI
jgi:DNA invertase Pin-like site-specific DNA recombinase